MALSLNAYDEPYVVNAALARRLESGEDNCCSYVFLLSAVGWVALDPRCACEIGTPRNRFTIRLQVIRTKKKVKFVVFYNLCRANLKGPNAAEVKRMAFKQALDYVDHICDIRIVRYYHYHLGILTLVALSLLRRPWIKMDIFSSVPWGGTTGRPFKKMKN